VVDFINRVTLLAAYYKPQPFVEVEFMKPDSELQKYTINFGLHPLLLDNHTSKKPSSHQKLKPSLTKTIKHQTDRVTRQKWISKAAYFKAKRRGFTPGHDVSDWLEAEQEYVRNRVELFLSVCKEDGEMTITGLRDLAKAIGVVKSEQIDSKLKLIRLIQLASHHRPCFRTKYGELCKDRHNCHWIAECQKLVAEWYR
jgi:Protein of unknown function (DUF2934)